jgi:hypothetical protein
MPGNPNWQPGGSEYRPAKGAGIGGEAKGAGWGGEAKGMPPSWDADSQPSPEAKSAGKAGKAAMHLYFEARRISYAEALDDIATTDPDSGRRLAAINSIIDRLDGKATVALSGPDGEPLPSSIAVRFVRPD